MSNIFLIGMMGSGKTTTARELAKLQNLPAIDLDELIQNKTGKTINQIFAEQGEAAFRNLEHKFLDEIKNNSDLRLQHVVTSTGGGTVLTPANQNLMKLSGKIIYLKTSFSVLWERVKRSQTRPLLKTENPEQALQEIFKTRIPIYEKIANYTVDTDGKTPKQVAEEIYKILK